MKRPMNIIILSLFAAVLISGCVGFGVPLPEPTWNLVWSDSFEDGTVDEYPPGWDVGSSHAPGHGPRIVDASDVSVIDGDKALRLYGVNNTSKVMRSFDPVERGRLELYILVPSGDERGQIDVELYAGSQRLLGIVMGRDGRRMYRDENRVGKDDYGADKPTYLPLGVWHKFAVEWDSTKRVFHAFYIDTDTNQATRYTPPEGVPFAGSGTETPSRLELRLGTSEQPRSAVVDAIELYALEY